MLSMGKGSRRGRDWGTGAFVCGLLAPAVLLYFGLVLWPMEQSFWVAFHRWRGLSGSMTFVGFDNFRQIAGDDSFRAALGHNFAFFLMAATAVLTLGLFFANALAGQPGQRVRGLELFRALFLFPNVVSIVAVAILWMFLYNPNWGLVNAMLRLVGLGSWAKTWLGNQSTVMPAVTVAYVWYVLGFYILLFRAGIQGVPAEINEAASIDGATGSQRFWLVTVPLLNDILRLGVIHLVISSMNLFALIWVLAPPTSVGNATEVSLTYLYQKGFTEQQFGYSTAIGAVNFLIVMGITVLLQRVWKPREA
jgi:N-acetylglucosamine transport system permease protein